jgi:hypothetical protein
LSESVSKGNTHHVGCAAELCAKYVASDRDIPSTGDRGLIGDVGYLNIFLVETEQAMANDTVPCEMDECLQTDSVYKRIVFTNG